MNRIGAGESRPSYARPSDFCRIFEREMHALYSLAFLLTADTSAAEKCFNNAFDDCLGQTNVFLGWERSWSRRTIVKHAIEIVRPTPDYSAVEYGSSFNVGGDPGSRLLRLRPFERFVFSVTVLEHFTVRDCAALLNCRPSEVEAARMRALERIADTDLPPHAIAERHAPRLQAANAAASA